MKYFFTLLVCSLALASCTEDPCETTACFNGGICIDGECECPFLYGGDDCQIEYSDTKTITFWTDQAMCDYYNNEWIPAEFGLAWEVRIYDQNPNTPYSELVKTFYPCANVQSTAPDCNDGFFDYQFQWTPEMGNEHTIRFSITASTLSNGVSLEDGGIGTYYNGQQNITIALEDNCTVARIY